MKKYRIYTQEYVIDVVAYGYTMWPAVIDFKDEIGAVIAEFHRDKIIGWSESEIHDDEDEDI